MPKSKTMELAIKIAGKVDKSLGTSVKTSSKQLKHHHPGCQQGV